MNIPAPEWTGERFLPWMETEQAQIHYHHLHRYAFATHFVKGKKILDLACGEGYGTYMLSREAECAVGVDIDRLTIEHARGKYVRDNLGFIEGSILAVPISERKFDVIVCFEAIEHIVDHDGLLSEIRRLLKEDGLFIVSTPNKKTYTDEPSRHNPFHMKELYLDEFTGLLRKYFANVEIFGQRTYVGSNIWSASHKINHYCTESVIKKKGQEFYFSEENVKEPLYIIALASNTRPTISITDSWLTDASSTLLKDYERQLQDCGQQIYTLESQIYQFQQSIPMQLANRYQGVIEKLLRPGTRRRRYYELIFSGIKVILNEGWKSFFRKLKSRFSVRKAKTDNKQ